MIDPSKFLEGRVCYLRPFSEQDIPTWTSWFNHPVTTQLLEQGYFPTTTLNQKERFERLGTSTQDLQLAVVERERNQLVGTIALHHIDWIHRTGDISIVIGDDSARGKGIGGEAVKLLVKHAFGKLNLNKLTAGVVAINEASLKLFQSVGFKEEGRLRQQLYMEGRYQDVYRLGLLASERKVD